jgi:trehalose 6-phosphate phosphatase
MPTPPPLPAAGDRWALFLDIDGTLLPIATTPQAARVDPALLHLLERLRRGCGGAVALVSGRSLVDIDRLFVPLRPAAAGLHGWQRRRNDGALVPACEPRELLTPLRPALAAYVAARPGLLLEDKGASLAIHYRQARGYGPAIRRLARQLVAERPRLRLIEGRRVVELQPHGADKGRAVAAFLAEPPFAGRFPIYVGDDTTDEDGFRSVNRLGGISVRVTGGDQRARPTEARWGLRSVAALRHWLGAVAARLSTAAAADGPPLGEPRQSLMC